LVLAAFTMESMRPDPIMMA